MSSKAGFVGHEMGIKKTHKIKTKKEEAIVFI